MRLNESFIRPTNSLPSHSILSRTPCICRVAKLYIYVAIGTNNFYDGPQTPERVASTLSYDNDLLGCMILVDNLQLFNLGGPCHSETDGGMCVKCRS